MAGSEGKHVFVSYVREDSASVDQLCKVLEAAQIPYWRDRKDLGPGDAWRVKIRQAIRGGSIVFLACFSANTRARDRSHMNEELHLAVEEYRQLPPGRTWLIPVRFDDGAVPEWELGPGRTLNDLNYSDFFGSGLAAAAASLVTTVHRAMGTRQLNSAATLNAVEQATAANRLDLLRRLTKEMLPDPARRIELDDLVGQEVRRIAEVIGEADDAKPSGESTGQFVVRLAALAEEIAELTIPFCASLQVAARYGFPEQLTPWSEGTRLLIQAANRNSNVSRRYADLAHLPGVLALATAGLAAGASRRWDNLKALTVDGFIRSSYDANPVSLLEASYPYKPFDLDGWTANTLALARYSGTTLEEALAAFTDGRRRKGSTPVADWLYAVLRPVFIDQLADDENYDAEYDRAEVILGVLAEDLIKQRLAANPGGPQWAHSQWFGRSTKRPGRYGGDPVEDLKQELAVNSSTWPPLRAELFGGEVVRAAAALETYGEMFGRLARDRYY